jgi:hypothetical protein
MENNCALTLVVDSLTVIQLIPILQNLPPEGKYEENTTSSSGHLCCICIYMLPILNKNYILTNLPKRNLFDKRPSVSVSTFRY